MKIIVLLIFCLSMTRVNSQNSKIEFGEYYMSFRDSNIFRLEKTSDDFFHEIGAYKLNEKNKEISLQLIDTLLINYIDTFSGFTKSFDSSFVHIGIEFLHVNLKQTMFFDSLEIFINGKSHFCERDSAFFIIEKTDKIVLEILNKTIEVNMEKNHNHLVLSFFYEASLGVDKNIEFPKEITINKKKYKVTTTI